MTVYPKIVQDHKLTIVETNSPLLLKLNIVLVILILAVMAGYIFFSNLLTAQKYALSVSKNKFDQISAVTSREQDVIDRDIGELLQFAQKSGMVEAKDTVTVLEETGFALSERGF